MLPWVSQCEMGPHSTLAEWSGCQGFSEYTEHMAVPTTKGICVHTTRGYWGMAAHILGEDVESSGVGSLAER